MGKHFLGRRSQNSLIDWLSKGKRSWLAPALFLAVTCAMLIEAEQALARGSKSSSSKGQQSDDPGCRTCLSKAASLFASGHVSDAAELLGSWKDRCRGSSQLQLLLSTVLLRQGGHMEEATAAARQACQAAPESLAAHLQLGLLLSAAENNMQAAVELARAVEIDPSSYEGWSSLSAAYAKLHEDDKAQACAAKAADLEPGTKTVRLRTLHNLEHAGRITEAKAELKRLVAGDYTPEFLQQLADEGVTIGDWDDALTAATKVSESYPRAIAPLKIIAVCQLNNRAYQDCLSTADKMLKLDAKSADARALRGRALCKQGSAGEAQKELSEALAAAPELPEAWLGMGELEFGRGNYKAAGDNLQHSIDAEASFGDRADVCYLLGQCLEKQGERESALSYYKKSLTRGLSGAEADQAKQALARLSASGSR